MSLYADFTETEWQNILGVTKLSLPRGLIVHGEWEHESNLRLWNKMFLDPRTPKWNTVLGKIDNVRIGYSNVYGGPMAANIVHQFAGAGVKKFIQTGYCGGLNEDFHYGDILIVKKAKFEHGLPSKYSSDAYGYSDESLVQEAITYCEEKDYSYTVGTIISTDSMLLESEGDLLSWSQEDYMGIDMETATTLTVCNYFKTQAVGLLNMSDNLLHKDNIFQYHSDREKIEEQTDARIRDVAIHLAEL